MASRAKRKTPPPEPIPDGPFAGYWKKQRVRVLLDDVVRWGIFSHTGAYGWAFVSAGKSAGWWVSPEQLEPAEVQQ